MSNLHALPQSLHQLGQTRFASLYEGQTEQQKIINLLSLSDFAWNCLQSQPNLKDWLLDDKELANRAVEAPLSSTEINELDDNAAMAKLRLYREKYWLKVAFLDLCCANPIADSIAYISALANQLIDSANQWAFAQVAKVSGMPLDDDGNAMQMLVLGMGKLGGGELNYSSDIDLIFSYPRVVATQGGRRSIEAQVFYTKVAQKLIMALNQTTVNGQVFRVDMRLRPFGESGPLVMSFHAMEDYYQEQGREWERYAMLKGRLIGTENRYWNEFYELLRPFVYRRYIDFSVIESLRKMKQMIAQEVRRKRLTNNIKLGAGGIREVEFVVQALQMVRGGREANLQTQSLLVALKELVNNQVMSNKEAELLTQNYLDLRQIEQYLQIFADKQTQTLPDDELNQQRLCYLLNKDDFNQCLSSIEQIMSQVHGEFEQVIGFESETSDPCENEYISAWEMTDVSLMCEPNLDWQAALEDFKARLTKAKV
ncbi:MAG: bifunctional [glutamate--ammonia ligase]-adenylyl-L-tyrosine phosphorylase/[glutamate--ammonia-ligase] adenylyltransferase, partial [Pseudomonadota bacterium]|nr:bifunctional [glutamate--ammonia ligase]-adenylyl-L-tyrosine phosphorylase/[glutamate--ammonia-ligase] adenylyltransferase [Pseudomonadota bacterium]